MGDVVHYVEIVVVFALFPQLNASWSSRHPFNPFIPSMLLFDILLINLGFDMRMFDLDRGNNLKDSLFLNHILLKNFYKFHHRIVLDNPRINHFKSVQYFLNNILKRKWNHNEEIFGSFEQYLAPLRGHNYIFQ